jgi:hypothetical protein
MTRKAISLGEALGRAHAKLLDDLQQLEDVASGESVAKLHQRLASTRTDLLAHFRFEERGGYMEAVKQQEPRLERFVDQLAHEHKDLADALEALVGQARVAAGLDAALRAGVRGWIERVRAHEARENDLVQNAFNLDIGAKD